MIWSLLVAVTVTKFSQRQDNRVFHGRFEKQFSVLFPQIRRDRALRWSCEHRDSNFPFLFTSYFLTSTQKNIHELSVEADDMFRTSASLLKVIKQNKVSDVKSALTLQFGRLCLLSHKAYVYSRQLSSYVMRKLFRMVKRSLRNGFLGEQSVQAIKYYGIGGAYKLVRAHEQKGGFMLVTLIDFHEQLCRCVSEVKKRYEHLLEFIAYWKEKVGLE